MTGVDLELAHGYTLAQVQHLAKAAVNLSGTYASDYLDRLHAAHSSIIEALYTAEHWPARYDLIRAGATAVARLVEADLRSRGYRRGSGYNGAASAPGFALYWWDLSAPAPSPEDAVVERTAIRQIIGLLTPKQLAAVTALAATGNHDAAAKALGRAPITGRGFVSCPGWPHPGSLPSRVSTAMDRLARWSPEWFDARTSFWDALAGRHLHDGHGVDELNPTTGQVTG